MRPEIVLLIAFAGISPSRGSEPGEAVASSLIHTPEPDAPNVIFDTDIMSDIDDVLALAMLHALQDRHEANLIAVTVSTDDKWCASYVDLVDTFYGHEDIPIGIVHNGVDLRRADPGRIPSGPNYTEVLSSAKNQDGSERYAHQLVDGSKALPAVEVLRKALASHPDHSVVIVQVGFSTNLAHLLQSSPDSASPLSGVELIRGKVRLLSIMAGNYGPYDSGGVHHESGQPEFNLLMDVTSAQILLSEWPTPIVASGFEVGIRPLFPGYAIERYFRYSTDDPIADAYRAYVAWGKEKWLLKSPHDHPTFDLTSVLYAVRPDAGYFRLSPAGRISVTGQGVSRFQVDSLGRDRYLILDPAMKDRVAEAMTMLATQPPVCGARR